MSGGAGAVPAGLAAAVAAGRALAAGEECPLARRPAAARAAFLAHAAVAAAGHGLVAVGARALELAEADWRQGAGPRPSEAEVGLAGWAEADGSFAFRYVPDTDPEARVTLQAVEVDGVLALSALRASPGAAAPAPPTTVELNLADTVAADDEGAPARTSFVKLFCGWDVLEAQLGALLAGLQSPPPQPRAEPRRQRARSPPPDASPSPSPRPGPALRPRGPPLLAVGGEDVVPAGLRPPGVPVGGGGGAGGGMLFGPDHPAFRGGLGGAGGLGGPSRPPGVRWDPISPPGLPGFEPPGGGFGGGLRPPLHPDVMQPGTGGGDLDLGPRPGPGRGPGGGFGGFGDDMFG